MLKYHKLGAIDVGSNSVRLLITNVFPDRKQVHFKKSSLIRLPIRLGADAFTKGKISKKNYNRMVEGMRAFQSIMKVHQVEAYRACATSAMRDAINGTSLVAAIRKETGIPIEIIDGAEEARLIFNSGLLQAIQPEEDCFLYVDVGGGSTEISIFEGSRLVASQSFNIGTIRILNKLDTKASWADMKSWVQEHVRGLSTPGMIASGGNINRLFKLSGRKYGTPLDRDYLETSFEFLQKFTQEELIKRFDLNIDRADVIIPAMRIYMSVLQWADGQQVYVPKVGVSDGIVRDLYKREFQG
jgi:exopolyphosphatase/guanosine-5'-triphosphate,3'-diphosphate pyrophosphatase